MTRRPLTGATVARQVRPLRHRPSGSRISAGVFVTGRCNPHWEGPHVDRQGPTALESHVQGSSATAPHAGAAISGVIMRMYRLLFAALCMASLVLTGCSKSGSNSGNAQLRILNAFSEAPALNVSVASTPVVSGLPFQGLTQYTSVTSGTPLITVGVSGASTTLINTMYNVSPGTNYTFIVYG